MSDLPDPPGGLMGYDVRIEVPALEDPGGERDRQREVLLAVVPKDTPQAPQDQAAARAQ